jgi:hypothetical protein
VEVSLFGPGYGECVIVGLNDTWIIVDSCIDEHGEPAALSYLRSIGVDPATLVRFVIATHWHDDHVRGLATVLKECKEAQFICSAALSTREFLTLASMKDTSGRTGSSKVSAGVQELADILHILETRTNLTGQRNHLVFATADRRLWQRERTSAAPACEVWSLSPSDRSIQKAQQDLARLFNEARERSASSHVRPASPNHVAVALWVQFGSDTMLLGSDLEESRGVAGWSAILASTSKPVGAAGVFKVAHHGSSNAHHPGVWSEMLVSNAVGVLTRFQRGSISLPTDADIKRIMGLTNRAYVTSVGSAPKKKRSATIDKTIKGAVRTFRTARLPMGHIRLRSAGVGWNVELFGAAAQLTS